MFVIRKSVLFWTGLIIMAGGTVALAAPKVHRAPPAPHRAPPAFNMKVAKFLKFKPRSNNQGNNKGKPPGNNQGNNKGKPPGNHHSPLGKHGWWKHQGPHHGYWSPRPRPYVEVIPYCPPPAEPEAAPLELLNETDIMLRCRINGEIVTFAPGQGIPFPGGRLWVIEFHRGGPFGTARYELTEGVYRFGRNDQGWTLMPVEAPQPESEIPPNPLGY